MTRVLTLLVLLAFGMSACAPTPKTAARGVDWNNVMAANAKVAKVQHGLNLIKPGFY